jgi:hypothetical protein
MLTRFGAIPIRLSGLLFIAMAIFSIAAQPAKAPEPVSFKQQVLPIIRQHCALSGCHNAESKMSGYILTSYATITEKSVVAKKPEKSILMRVLDPSYPKHMPPKDHAPLTPEAIETIRQWILEGAKPTN